MKARSALWPSTATVTTWSPSAWAFSTAATMASASASGDTWQKRCTTPSPTDGPTGSLMAGQCRSGPGRPILGLPVFLGRSGELTFCSPTCPSENQEPSCRAVRAAVAVVLFLAALVVTTGPAGAGESPVSASLSAVCNPDTGDYQVTLTVGAFRDVTLDIGRFYAYDSRRRVEITKGLLDVRSHRDRTRGSTPS